jgi:hypothetical protein
MMKLLESVVFSVHYAVRLPSNTKCYVKDCELIV